MIESNIFLLQTLQAYLNVGIPCLTSDEKNKLRRKILYSQDFLNFQLPDRRLVLKDVVRDIISNTFLVFLLNEECDKRRLNYFQISYSNIYGKVKAVFDYIVYEIFNTKVDKITYLKHAYNKIETVFEIGYEKHFFNIKDELLLYVMSRINFTFLECLFYYDKTLDDLLESKCELSNRLKMIILSLYQKSKTNENQMRLILKLLSVKVRVVEKLDYEALCENGRILIRQEKDLADVYLEFMLLHEACHMIVSYEERYKDFYNAYLKIIPKNVMYHLWYNQKEKCVNEYLKTKCGLRHLYRYVTDPTYSDTNSIVTSVLMDVKKLNEKTSDASIWK